MNKKTLFMFVVFNIMFFFLSYMNPIYHFPVKGDPNIYINVAKEMLNGAVLYRDVFDHKGPFIFFIYLLPNLINNANLGLFLIDMLLFNIIAYFNVQTIKLSNNYLTAFLLITIELILLLCSYITASPELIALAIIAYANYWIISKRYKTPKIYELLLAGVLAGILFWTKYTLGLYLAIVFFYFFIKNKTWKNILLPLAGFMFPTVIVLGYFVINNSIQDLINCYFTINLGYQSTDKFVFTASLILLLTACAIVLIAAIIKKKPDYLILAVAHLCLTIPVFFMTGYTWGNLFTPFISVVSLFSVFNFEKLKKPIIILLVLSLILFGYMLYISASGNMMAGQLYHQLDSFAEDVNESGGKVMVFQTEPVLPWEINSIGYKYFFAPTLTYEQFPEMYEQIYADVSNGNLDYILVLLDDNGNIMPLSHFRTANEGELLTLQWVDKIANEIYENYEIHGKYYRFTAFKVKGAK